MPYNPTTHRRRTIRLKGYDYSQAGMYFVTICCQNRQCLFGEIENGEMILNEYGQIVCEELVKSAEIRNEIEIHEYIVMPNHIHVIIEITVGANGIRPYGNIPDGNICPIENVPVGNIHTVDDIFNGNIINGDKGECHSPLRSPSKTVGAFVRGFKSSVTKRIGYPVWQRNYWEHIIRNDNAYQTIANYIINNPQKWENDKFYTN